VLGGHLARCPECCAYANQIVAVRRAARLEVLPVVPDQTSAILGAIGAEPDASVRAWRIALVAVALVQLLAAIPNLFPDATGEVAHASRHLAAFGLALVGSLLFVAWRPQHASAVAPVLGLLAVLLVGLSTVDFLAGRVPVTDELRHGIALVGAGIVWVIGRVEGRPPIRAHRPLPSRS
jgi:predicted anti-sigma-YlaC factor YlaD